MRADSNLEQGFSLMEVILVVALVGSLLVTLTTVQLFTIERSGATQDGEERMAFAQAALNDMQQAIRYSTRVRAAAANILRIEGRHIADTDDELETVTYTVSDGQLIKTLVNSGVTTTEVLMDDIVGFQAYTLSIRDSFSSVDYADVNVATFGTAPTDTSTYTDYTVRGATDLGSNFVDAYDAQNERLAVTTNSNPTDVDLTPVLSKQGLTVDVVFVPQTEGKEYQVLRYGDPTSVAGSIGVVFRADNSVALRRIESNGVVEEEVSGELWEVLSSYRARLAFRDGRAWAILANGSTRSRIGQVGWGNMDDAVVQIETTGTHAQGNWDEFSVTYPEVQLRLTYRVDSTDKVLLGGATRRLE